MKKYAHEVGPIRLSRRHQLWIYLIGTLLHVSGLGWLIAHYFLATATEFGEVHHYSEPWWLKLHGGVAMVFLMVFGALLPAHAFRAWRLKKNRLSGAAMLGLVAVLVVSAYGLYYAGGDALRSWLGLIHWTIGLASMAVLFLHIWTGKRNQHRQRLHHKHIAPHHHHQH